MWPFSGKQLKGERAVFMIDGLHCTSCVLNIDGAVEDLPGVYSSSTNYAHSQTEVQYDPETISLEAIRQAIEQQGYGAVLPPSLQKPQES